MIRPAVLAASVLGLSVAVLAQPATAQSRAQYDAMVARHAAASGIPASLIHRVIMRESGYNAGIVSKGNYGLMQIKPATARSMGYTGPAGGLLDPETNMTYAVKYLAGAYKMAGGNADRAVSYYARGYYHAAKRQGLARPAGTFHGMNTFAAAAPVSGQRTTTVSAAERVATRVPNAPTAASPAARAEMTW